ncbi:mitochondrial import receptor subunit TOM70-like protein [Leptotrombidium deliense]|uniref:Mitochondrial import receptor subunit TOM70-like protein n=1 Tax=Leptotrombidium deliense TaxID=299467 RepID=A0A443S591_9ACAR|nr:mitochondrial import receptor subunit TOM70-like protein [Leptotrombidium deliense]
MSAANLDEALKLKKKGNELFKAAKYDDSIECYTKAIRICDCKENDHLSVFYCNRALASYRLQRYYSAVDDCTQAILLNCKYVKPLYYRYKAQKALSLLSDAVADITAVCVLQRDSDPAMVAERDQLLLFFSGMKAQQLTMKLPRIRLPEYEIKKYFRSFTSHPLFDGSFNGEKIFQLFEDIQRSQNVVNREAKLGLIEGTIYFLNGKNSFPGLFILEKAVSDVVNDLKLKIICLIQLANLKANLLKHVPTSQEGMQDVLNTFHRALQLSSDNVNILYHRAKFYFAFGLFDKGFADLRHCLSIDSSFEPPRVMQFSQRLNYAMRQHDLRDMVKIFKDIESFIDYNPRSSEVCYLYSLLMLEQEHLEKADEYASRALKADDKNPKLYMLKAELAAALSSDIRSGMKYTLKAIEVNNRSLPAFELMSLMVAESGNITEAIVYTDKAIANIRDVLDCTRLCCLRELYISRLNACKILGLSYSNAKFTPVNEYMKKIFFAMLDAYENCKKPPQIRERERLTWEFFNSAI